jgi:TonB-dependent starch-binding outer membrane protein SusC
LNESITYARRFGEHDINIMLMAEQIESSGDDFDTRREIQVIPGMDQLFAFSGDKANWDNSGTSNESGRVSYLGRLNYSYLDKYLLEGSFRADASPHFPKNSQWGYFPSVAVGWKISEENFFSDNVGFVNDLKVRFQIGLIGRDAIANYQYKERYTQTTGMLFGSTMSNGLNNNSIPNSQITWETALYKNLGFDGTFLNKKFNFSIDLYNRYTYDMFDSPTSTVPTSFGGTISYQNYAKLKSWGLEAALGYNGKVREFNYFISINAGMTDNKVIRKYVSDGDAGTWRDPNGRRTDSGIEGYQSLGIVRTQEELDAFLAANTNYKIDGEVPKVGWVLFQDQDGDGTITDKDRVRLTGRSGSRVGIGYNLGASWKGFKVSANIAWSIGGYDTYDKPARTVPTATQSALTHWKDATSTSNPNGKYPALDARYGAEIYNLWIVSATTMRVNNMTLSYSLPSELIAKLKIPQLRILLTGTNLWDIVNHQPYKYSTSNLSTDYPAMRTYTLGVNLTL